MNGKKLLRPAFRDYIRALPHLITGSAPAPSFGLYYEFADIGFVFISQFFIPVALYFLYQYSPFMISYNTLFNIWNTVVLGIFLLAVYWLLFVYRFAAFKPRENYADWVDLLCPDEEKAQPEQPKQPFIKQRIRSAFCFAALLTVITGLMLIYCLVGRGQSVERFYNTHKEQLNRLVEITQKYEDFHADVWCIPPYIYDIGDVSDISENDKDEIVYILSGLNSSEIYIFSSFTVEGILIFNLRDRWGDGYELQWFPFIVPDPTGNETSDMLFSLKTDLKKLDDHWRYFSERYKLYWGMHGK